MILGSGRPLFIHGLGANPRQQLLFGVAVFFLARLALTFARTGPLIVADEVGYLTNARVLAGGTPGQMSTAPFYRGGYSLLIAPLLALAGNPTTSYRFVLVLNALLAASLAPLLYILLTRCFDIPPRAAVWPALAAAAYPSVTIYTQVAMSENLLMPLTVLWLLCFGCLLQARTESRRLAWGAGTAACAVFLWAVHGRMIVAITITAVVFLAIVLTRQPTARAALLGLAIIAAGLFAVHLLNNFLIARSYGGHTTNEFQQRLSTLNSLSGVGAFCRNLVGQTWYLMVASLGILVAAVIPAPRLSLRGREASRQHLLVLLAVLTGVCLLVESALSFRDVERPDMIIYGRYAEVVLPPLFALALARWSHGRHRSVRPVLLALGVVTLAVVLLRTTVSPLGEANRWNVASLPSLTLDLGPIVLAAAGVASAIAYWGLSAVRRRAPAAVAPAVVVLFLVITAVIEHNPVLTGQQSFYPANWTSPAVAAGGARTIAFDTDVGGGLWVYQWFAPHQRFVLFSGSTTPPPSRLVISRSTWATANSRLRPTAIWRDPGRGEILFRLARTH